uniref:NADH-ubiquinone oxidoreductase chain 4L n=3 Tax=Cheumatopsyche TaxID=177865 RepID=A0A3G1ND81_9NEOP|nr:NADH dehydrogenase subunit 4L [Cheumatopsyche speciosa]YP_009459930.1 NADH dehydrogenase subunit 4L [Cheumatopsyche campyla]YP_009459943.1 NADH dehydrogenase subunit 4L [Cheumatopsyche analis]AUT18169.1 NADH dehydrogenase subunit 4L [Cheumatopsyche speciosa]AUT18195.1 NADH dehydrogenase subunit 4L [Cheumatopsyche campyla]AUT18208.1 NADH dehydrogenase subunit 4L [Cheumatopsyche analis]
MILYLYMFILIFLMGNVMFILNRKHLLNMLLSLEMLMMVLLISFSLIFLNLINEEYFLLLFMIFMVSEGTLGLSILVSLIRLVGSDYFQIYNLMGC